MPWEPVETTNFVCNTDAFAGTHPWCSIGVCCIFINIVFSNVNPVVALWKGRLLNLLPLLCVLLATNTCDLGILAAHCILTAVDIWIQRLKCVWQNKITSFTWILHLWLLLLLISSPPPSSPLCRVFILIFLRQTMSLGNTVLQLFCCYYSWCL